MSFRHGQFELMAVRNVLVSYACGTWNKDTALEYSEQVQALLAQLNKPFCHLLLLDDWQLMVPEAEAIIQQCAAHCVEHGLRHTATVFSHSSLKDFQLQRTQAVHPLLTKQSFERLDVALEYLNAMGYAQIRQIETTASQFELIGEYFSLA